MRKRVLSILIATLMVVSLLPVTALAVDPNVGGLITIRDINYIVIATGNPNTLEVSDNTSYSESSLTIDELFSNNQIDYTVTSIGNSAFAGCNGLTSVDLPSSVTNIDESAFKGCTSLSSVTCKATTPPSLGSDAFVNCSNALKIYVPKASVESYKTATNWSTYADKIEAFYTIADILPENFPTSQETGWSNRKGAIVYKTDKVFNIFNLVFTNEIPLSTILEKSNNQYTDGKYSFNMESDELVSISVAGSGIDAGTYLPYQPWSASTHSNKLPDEPGSYYLTEDVTLGASWNVPTGTTNLDLNGCVIEKTGNGSVIRVDDGATLNLYDCGTTEHKGYVDVAGLWHWDKDGTYVPQQGETEKPITGGIITGGVGNDYGGGVNLHNGTFTMNGGSIVGNTANKGGGVYVPSHTNNKFTVNGGNIDHNTAGYGGGVYVNSGEFTMNGGSIDRNTSTKQGGGVYHGGGTFTMHGGSIDHNTASKGGGVYAYESITLGGTAKITGNTADNATNNVYLEKNEYITLANALNAPTTGMLVGVTTQTAPTATPVAITTNGTTGDTNYFFSDIPKYYVSFVEDHLELKPITITFDANGGTCASESARTSAGGKLAELPTATRNGYTFNGWYTLASGGENITTSTVFTSDTTIYAQWTEVSAPPAPIYYDDTPTVTVPVSGDENTVKVSAKISGNTATVKKIKDADLEKVTEGEGVTIDLSGAGKNIDTAKIPTETVEKIAEKRSKTVKLPVAAVEFDKAATEEIVDQAKGSNIELVVDDVKEVSLNAVQKESVKKLDTAVIIDAYLESNGSRLCTADNGGFGGGKAKVILPYEIKNNRTAENYSVFYVSEEGRLEKLNAEYDEELEAFVFEIEHLSNYALAYDDYLMPFVDVPTDEYYDAIKWAAKNAVTDGVDPVHFNPTGITNRAQMVTFLWKLAGRPEPTISECPFTDVKEGSYYYKAVLWAYENGVTDGTSETTFEPEKNMSRAEAVTFLWKYEGRPYVDYYMEMTDVNEEAYYAEAVRWALAEKITKGTSETTFSPDGDCLRNQIVTFLYRLFFDRTFVE